jgi:hypothetical protein
VTRDCPWSEKANRTFSGVARAVCRKFPLVRFAGRRTFLKSRFRTGENRRQAVLTVRLETLTDNMPKLSRTFSLLDFHATPPTDLNPQIVKELPKEKIFLENFHWNAKRSPTEGQTGWRSNPELFVMTLHSSHPRHSSKQAIQQHRTDRLFPGKDESRRPE